MEELQQENESLKRQNEELKQLLFRILQEGNEAMVTIKSRFQEVETKILEHVVNDAQGIQASLKRVQIRDPPIQESEDFASDKASLASTKSDVTTSSEWAEAMERNHDVDNFVN